MDSATYAVEDVVERDHWWFCGRRVLFRRLLERTGTPLSGRVLDMGAGTGANLRLLREMGFENVAGLDASPQALDASRGKGFTRLVNGDAKRLPFADACFDVVLATDILEHVDDDQAALDEIRRVLRPSGRALVTVPAFMAPWGLQDEVSRHLRRYTMGELATRCDRAGLVREQGFYFNYILFAPIWLARQAMKLLRPNVASENELNTGALNAVLKALFRVDVATAPLLRPPFGVSALVLVRRP